MDPKRWVRICETFEAARHLHGAARDALLAASSDVAQEVQDLLREHELESNVLRTEPRDPFLGTRVGAYEIERLLGAGGMATVYLARGPDGPVAVKRLQPLLMREPVIRERFRREAALGVRIRHPHVVRTLGRVGPDCLVMEWIEGETLQSVLRTQGALPESACCRIGREVAEALQAVHEAGAVHRDVKPSNVMQCHDGTTKLMDLGIALPLDEMLRLSRTGEFIGTVRYSAPEHLAPRPQPLDGRADLYALGLLLYELASGSHVHPQGGLVSTMRAHLESEPPRLGTRVPSVSGAFESLVQALLYKDPALRPGSAEEVAARLGGLAGV